MLIPDAREQPLAATEDDRVNDQPDLVYEALVHQARYERRASDDVDGATRLFLNGPEFADLTHEAS